MSTYCIDIDNTICHTINNDYVNSIPIKSRIKIINSWYDFGHTIKYFTARGMGRSGDDLSYAYNNLYRLTKQQLDDWGCKYNILLLGKPSADYYIDDKNLCIKDVFDENS